MLYQTHYNRALRLPEQGSPERIVETAGYMTNKQKIEAIINAGKRLVDYRKEQYDFDDQHVDDDFIDPTRSKNFDLADATILSRQAQSRLRAQQKAYEDKLEADKVKAQSVDPKPLTEA